MVRCHDGKVDFSRNSGFVRPTRVPHTTGGRYSDVSTASGAPLKRRRIKRVDRSRRGDGMKAFLINVSRCGE